MCCLLIPLLRLSFFSPQKIHIFQWCTFGSQDKSQHGCRHVFTCGWVHAERVTPHNVHLIAEFLRWVTFWWHYYLAVGQSRSDTLDLRSATSEYLFYCLPLRKDKQKCFSYNPWMSPFTLFQFLFSKEEKKNQRCKSWSQKHLRLKKKKKMARMKYYRWVYFHLHEAPQGQCNSSQVYLDE